MSKNRLEAFSDGVFAVAITLLVLDLKVPKAPTGLEHHVTLAHQLGAEWPSYAAFIVSFLTIGIIWINHHAMMNRLRIVNHSVMTLNLALLLCVAALPFATSLMATYLNAGRGDRLAAAVYSLSFLAMSILFATTNGYILFGRARSLSTGLGERQRRAVLTRGVVGLIPYAFAAALAPVSAYASVAICAAVAGFYALPFASGSELTT